MFECNTVINTIIVYTYIQRVNSIWCNFSVIRCELCTFKSSCHDKSFSCETASFLHTNSMWFSQQIALNFTNWVGKIVFHNETLTRPDFKGVWNTWVLLGSVHWTWLRSEYATMCACVCLPISTPISSSPCSCLFQRCYHHQIEIHLNIKMSILPSKEW